MMIQKVINYDWDEKIGNCENNWWKAQISIATREKRISACLKSFLVINIRKEKKNIAVSFFISSNLIHPLSSSFTEYIFLYVYVFTHWEGFIVVKRMKRNFLFQSFFKKSCFMLKMTLHKFFSSPHSFALFSKMIFKVWRVLKVELLLRNFINLNGLFS